MKRTTKKKSTKKRTVKKRVTKQGGAKAVKIKPIGKVTHYFAHAKVAVVKFKQVVKAGIKVNFKGATTDFMQTVTSMQRNHKKIAAAPKNKEVGVKVSKRVRGGDEVFLA